jgi:competence protein ComEA
MQHLWKAFSLSVLLAIISCPPGLLAADPKPAAESTANSGTDSGQHTSSTTKQKKVDLNQATLEELETLPGIGAATAKAIIKGRPYHSINQLTNVSGIGPSKLNALKSRVTVKRQKAAEATVSAPNDHSASKPQLATPPASGAAADNASGSSTKTVPHTAKTLPVDGAKVNLNTATKEQLDALPGIGPTKAQAIIDARPFSSIEDVKRVKGIKEGTFSKIKDQITVE